MARFVESSTPQHFYGSTSTHTPSYGGETDDGALFVNEVSQEPSLKRRKTITGSMEIIRPTRLEMIDYSKLIERIDSHDSLDNSAESTPLLIKDALVTGHSYKLLKITQVETRWGLKMVWLLQDVDDDEDTVPQKVYGSKTLARYVTKNGQLDQGMVNCLKTCRINYYGYLGDELYGVSKYLFTVTV